MDFSDILYSNVFENVYTALRKQMTYSFSAYFPSKQILSFVFARQLNKTYYDPHKYYIDTYHLLCLFSHITDNPRNPPEDVFPCYFVSPRRQASSERYEATHCCFNVGPASKTVDQH